MRAAVAITKTPGAVAAVTVAKAGNVAVAGMMRHAPQHLDILLGLVETVPVELVIT